MRKVLYFLGELSDTDIEWLTVSGHKLTLQPGDVLIREQRPLRWFVYAAQRRVSSTT